MERLNPHQIDAIEAAARGWDGTPFCADSAVRGAGVCCHRLVAEIYREAGVIPPAVSIPGGSPQWSRAQHRSPIADWIESGDGAQWFEPIFTAQAEPGDLLGFTIGRCIHHLAIALRGGRIVHAVEGHGARIVEHVPAVWSRRLAATWRPRNVQRA